MESFGFLNTAEDQSDSEDDSGVAMNPQKKRKLLEISRRFTSEVERTLDSTDESPLPSIVRT